MSDRTLQSGTNRANRSVARRIAKAALVTVGIIGAISATTMAVMHPRADRTWVAQHAVMAHADMRGDSVHLQRLRNFSSTSEEQFTPAYTDRDYDLTKLETVWFIVTPFSKHWRGPAHTFVSFGFSDSQYVAISVEARREATESYGALTGLLCTSIPSARPPPELARYSRRCSPARTRSRPGRSSTTL